MNKILIVVDLQNGFTRYEQTKRVSKKIIELANSGLFDKIIATRFINKEGSQYTDILNWHRLMSSPDIDLVDGLKADVVVDKFIYTCVTPDFLAKLKELNDGKLPTHVFICGVDTDCCVLKTATDIFEQGLMPIVLTDYCDSNGGPKYNEAGKLAMERLIGKKSLVPSLISSKEELEKIIIERKY